MSEGIYNQASVLVLRGEEVGRDRYNRPIYGPPAEVPAPCWFTGRTASENTESAAQYLTDYLVQWPGRFHAQVAAADAVRLPMGTFELQGRPIYQPAGFITPDATVATVELVEG